MNYLVLYVEKRMLDPMNKFFKDYFGSPIVYTLPVTRTKGEVFTKTSIQKQDDGKYRVSVSIFRDGDVDNLIDTVDTFDAAKKFINDNRPNRC